MKNAESEEGKTWEEELYWKHFHAVHFYQVLPDDFLHHLVLPSKFAENMSCKMPKKLSLIGPSGSSWDVEVSTTGNVAIVGEGWIDFAKTYKLEESYLLVFKYTQNLSFEVLIFDQKNLCEKERSYFVRKGLPKPNDNVGRKRSADETASREMMEDNDDGGGCDCDCVMSKKSKRCSGGGADNGKKNAVLEAPRATPSDESSDDLSDADDDVDPDFDSSEKTRDDGVDVVVVSSGGTPICQVSGSQNEAEVTNCVTSEKLKKCSADRERKNVVEAPITTLVKFKSSEKTKTMTKAVEVVSSGGRPNEADVADDTPISVLISGLVAINAKRPSAVKPSDNTTVNCTLNQHQQTPTGDGEKEMNEAAVLNSGNNCNTLSNTLSAEAKNGKGTPGTIRSLKVSAKKSRSVRAIPRSGKILTFKSDTQRLSKEYMSHRRPVTDEEKEAALKQATEALTEGGFHVVMRPTSVYKRFYLCIPAEWVDKHLSCNHQQVVLRAGEKTWVAMFHNYGPRGHSAGLATGWKSFALENNLEDSDVCVFKPATQNDNDLIFDVEIFRVVPEITPLTPVVCSI